MFKRAAMRVVGLGLSPSDNSHTRLYSSRLIFSRKPANENFVVGVECEAGAFYKRGREVN